MVEWNKNGPKHDHSASVIVIEIDSLGDFPSRDGEQDCATTIVTCLLNVSEWDERKSSRD